MIKVNPEIYAAAREALEAGVWRVDPEMGLLNPNGRHAGYINRDGYRQVGFNWNKHRHHPFAHRIVWEAFNGPITEGLYVNHVDGDKLNNAIANLELVSHAENMVHASSTGLLGFAMPERRDLAVKIYREAWESGDTAAVVAARHGVGANFVSKVKYGRTFAYATADIAVTPRDPRCKRRA